MQTVWLSLAVNPHRTPGFTAVNFRREDAEGLMDHKLFVSRTIQQLKRLNASAVLQQQICHVQVMKRNSTILFFFGSDFSGSMVFWSPQFKKCVSKLLERNKVMTTVKGLGTKCCEERMNELGVFHLGKTQCDSHLHIDYGAP